MQDGKKRKRLSTAWAAVLGAAVLLATAGLAPAGEEPHPGPDSDAVAESGPNGEAAPGTAGDPAGSQGKTDEEKPDPAPAPIPSEPEVIYVHRPVETKKKSKSLLVLEPRAMGYKFLKDRVRVGFGRDERSRIEGDRHLGLENVLFLSPEINTQLNFKILGFLARLHLSYTDITLHGLTQLSKDIGFSGTVFPAGTVVGTRFTHRRARIRYFQEVLQHEGVTLDVNLGGDYLFFRHILDSPGFAREKDVTETGFPVAGVRAFWVPVPWGRLYGALSGFYWNLGRETGASGLFEASIGFSIFFTPTWGFMVDFTFLWISHREGRTGRVAIDYFEFGPGIALYACL
jgi:hypothetical protein